MRLQQIDREKFKSLFDKSPTVIETNYKDLSINYWIHQQAIIGIKVIYRFDHISPQKQYYFVDMTELYECALTDVNVCIYDPETEIIETQKYNMIEVGDSKVSQ